MILSTLTTLAIVASVTLLPFAASIAIVVIGESVLS